MQQPTLRVLVVDDDEDDFLIVRDLLGDVRSTDYRIDWASSLQSGLEALRSGDFDVCLVDQLLGPEQGLDLIRTVADEGIQAPIILLTGASSPELDEAALNAGAADYLVKGASDAETLSRSIRYAVGAARFFQQIEDSERRYRALFEKNPGPMLIYDAESLDVLAVNDAATRVYGYTREEFLGMTLLDFHLADDREALLAFCSSGEPGYRDAGRWRHRYKDGSIHCVEFIRHDIEYHGRNANIALTRDVTAQVEAQSALETAHAQKRRLLEDMPEAIVVVDDHGFVQFANAATGSLFNAPVETLQGERLPHADALLQDHDREVEICRADGRRRVVQTRMTSTKWNDQHAKVLVLRDHTHRVETEAALVRAETHDAITGFERYPVFAARITNVLEQSDTDASSMTLLFIDLDRFHNINESLGYDAGDFTLRRVAARIAAVVGDAGEVTRYAGDEFLVVVSERDSRQALAIGEALRAAISEPIEADEFNAYITASIGVSHFPDDGTRWADLVRRAEMAMNQAKHHGGDHVAQFSVAAMVEMEARLALGRHLQEALRTREFRLNFQPIFGLQPRALLGFEALLRWHSAALGEISPARFIPVAESLGLLPEIGLWVLREACRQARAWLDAGRAGFTVSVNVSALQLLRPRFLPELADLLAEFRIPPGVLDVELTESVLMENFDATRHTLRTLRGLGVSISLDDFGTGYSSLAYLRELPLDRIKIDRSFVQDIPENGGAAVIARTIIGIAHEFQFKVCGEGVETEEQRAFLVECGCDMAQGYLLGRPVPPDQLPDSLWNSGALTA